MTNVTIKHNKEGLICGFVVSGHSNYKESGSDIICSSISTAVNLTLAIIEKMQLKYKFNIREDIPKTSFSLEEPNEYSQLILESFVEHISALSKEYKSYVKII